MNNTLKLIISLILPQLAGGIGSLFTGSKISSWYSTIEKPALNPPSWVFAPVWTTLFLLMGAALYLVWKTEPASAREALNIKLALWVFGFQLVLNTLWSILFFGLENPGAAFVEIVILWIVILINIFFFARVSTPAAWLLAPYLLWVSFAAYLNYSIWTLNL